MQDMVAEAIRPLREASIDVGLGAFFGPCSPVLRSSSSSLMVASIVACHAAYEDKGDLSIPVPEKMQNFALPEDDVEGTLVASASSSEVVDVVTGTSMGPHDGSAVITDVVAPVLQIMPELQEQCGESSVVLPMEQGSILRPWRLP